MTVTTHPTKNCNVIYIDGLEFYEKRPEAALLSLFTNKIPQYYQPTNQQRLAGPPTYTRYKCGYLIFALGSDHGKQKYAHQFADYITKHKLGKIFEMPPAVNPLHANREGVLFIWIPAWDALEVWWKDQPETDKVLASKNQL